MQDIVYKSTIGTGGFRFPHLLLLANNLTVEVSEEI